MKKTHIKQLNTSTIFCISTFLILLLCSSVNLFSQSAVGFAEAENGVLTGVIVNNSTTGFTGTGYVTGFKSNQDKVTVKLTAPSAGFYKLIIRYNSPYGDKTQDLIINDNTASPLVFPKTTSFSDLDAGKCVLKQGENTVTIRSNWGYMDVDNFSIFTALANTYTITPDLVDISANTETKGLYNFFVRHFGKMIISGQTNDYYEQVKTISGKYPLLRAWDFKSYTEGYPYLWKDGGETFGAYDDGSVQTAINWYNQTNKKGIVNFQWHWHSPSGGLVNTNTFYTQYTTFDVTQAVQVGTTENTLIIRDIDAIAVQLKKLQDAGVPVLWRPLHEAGGAWFWWGAKGSTACKQLYNILYDRLMNYHSLHNLIWVWSTPETDWYPGNDKVDIIGQDSYPGAYNYGAQKTAFDRLYNLTNGLKIIAMTENGPIPDPAECFSSDAPWSFFMSWSDLVASQNTTAHIVEVFDNPIVFSIGSVDNYSSVLETKFDLFQLNVNQLQKEIHIIGPDFSRIELIDSKGSIILNSTNNNRIIKTEAYNCGVYILKISSGKSVYSKKIIIS